MSGHSKWAQIKRKKAVADNKKGAAFTKLAKNIAIAAKHGKDPDMNPSLRTAIEAAHAANMPKENIEKAILKGAGEVPGAVYEEVMYEGYGPGGIAVIVACVTDNTNRTVNELRNIFAKHGGTLGSHGSVLYMFEQKGIAHFTNDDLANQNRDDIELLAIDAGAEDIVTEEEGIIIQTNRDNLESIVATLQQHNLRPSSFEIEWITTNITTPTPEVAEKLRAFVEALEEHDDVNNVVTNARF